MVKASLVLYIGGQEAGQIREVAVLEATLHRQVHCTPLLVPLDVCTSLLQGVAT